MVAADVHVPPAPRSAESTLLLPSHDTGKDTLKDSCAKGQEHKSKNGGGHQALNLLIVQAFICKLCL